MAVLESITKAPVGTWQFDPVHSDVSFEIVHAGVDTFKGGFDDFGATLADGVLAGSAKVASVDVKDEQLSGHLQTPDFFDSERFPEITFSSNDFQRGELTIKGVSKPVDVVTSFAGPSTDPFGRERIGIALETTIDRTEFGVSWNAPNQSGGDYLGNDVKIAAKLAFVKAAA